MLQKCGVFRFDNPFSLIRRHSSKWHFSFLDYHMKLLHCHVDVTATAVGADLGPCQTSMMKCFAKENPL